MTKIPHKAPRLVLALVAAGTFGAATMDVWQGHANAAPAEAMAGTDSRNAAAPAGMQDFTKITRQYGPAVVNISVTGTRKTGSQIAPGPGVDPFEFFRD